MQNLILKTGRGTFHSVYINDIVYLERLKGRTKVFLKDKSLRVNVSFDKLLEKLDKNFIQCHRKYAVNIKYVTKFNIKSIRLDNTEIPLGPYFKKDFIEFMFHKHKLI